MMFRKVLAALCGLRPEQMVGDPSRIVRRVVPAAIPLLNMFAFLSAGLGVASPSQADYSSILQTEGGGRPFSERVRFAAYRLCWLATLLFAICMAGPVWASCPSTVTLSVPAGGSIALDCPTDGGGFNWGF